MYFYKTLKVFAALNAAVRISAAPNAPNDNPARAALNTLPASAKIDRDVCIIGGGSSGVYTAIRTSDEGKSVAVVEQKGRLGGHTETYKDPATGQTIDIGVVVWHDLDLVRNYFGRFNISLIKVTENAASGTTTRYVDFRSGITANYTPPNPASAFANYASQLQQYPYLDNGFDLPDPVPADLLSPFSDFVKKYNLGDLLMTILLIGEGIGDLLAHPTLYVAKLAGVSTLSNAQTGFLTTADSDNSELYEAAGAALGENVFLNSNVIAIDRPANGTDDPTLVLIQTPSGQQLIQAKRLVIAIPQTPSNLEPFCLDENESSLFAKFNNSAYYTGLISNTGLPDNVDFSNVGIDTPYNLPVLPGLYNIQTTPVPGLHHVYYSSEATLSVDQVQADIEDTVARLRATQADNSTASPASDKLEFPIFSAHVPFELFVSSEEVASGFYSKVNALQGYRNTFYNGAAFQTHDSSLIWQFTETLLPKIVNGL